MDIVPPAWIELPKDLTANILGRLEVAEILESVQKVCTTWWKLCKDHPGMWRVITMKNFASGGLMNRHLLAMCRRAVDRGQGQLIELNLHDFCDSELLNYVVDRSSMLRSLKLVNCSEIERECLVEAVKKLPHLEELHLIHMPFIRPGDIESIGVSCPMLKSFTYNEPRPVGVVASNVHALAIAKAMPNLRHLQFVGQWIRNRGLEAILDGCPHLESLDLWDCFHLDLRGALGRRCFKQIKNFRPPLERMSPMMLYLETNGLLDIN